MPHVLTPVRRPFRALAEAFVPEVADLSAQQWARAEAEVERSLALRPESTGRQLRLFIRAVDLLARLRHGRSLSSLAPERRISLLRRLEKAPLLALRRGVWGTRTLTFLAFYGLPEVREAIGYRADVRGRERRRARPDGGEADRGHDGATKDPA